MPTDPKQLFAMCRNTGVNKAIAELFLGDVENKIKELFDVALENYEEAQRLQEDLDEAQERIAEKDQRIKDLEDG